MAMAQDIIESYGGLYPSASEAAFNLVWNAKAGHILLVDRMNSRFAEAS
jgi:hypothetical protein